MNTNFKAICLTGLCALILSATTLAEANQSFKHVVVYQEDGKFAGWPANNGAWLFEGDDMLVGFTRGEYELTDGHNIGAVETQLSWLARSTNGGNSWKAYNPERYVGDFGRSPQYKLLGKPIDFSAPGFALRMVGVAYHGAYDPNGHFFYSTNGGQAWNGPHSFGKLLDWPELKDNGFEELTPRTDYVILGKHEALLMISARKKKKFGSDKTFCARTTDGGKTFEFLSWIVPISDTARAVMPQTFKMSDGSLVTCLRRRSNYGQGKENWVDAYTSKDNGRSWQFSAKVGDAGSGNGNPPAITATQDGRLCAVFGDRAEGKMMAAYSTDEGKTWDTPFVLRDDFGSEDGETNDLGYPRIFCRSDGKMVALYYYSTLENLHHIAATIWDPTS